MFNQVSSLLFLTLGACALLGFGGFSLISWREGERRATRVALMLALGGALPLFGTAFLPANLKLYILIGLALVTLAGLAAFYWPAGSVDLGNDIPLRQYDERDIMFARARLRPGSPEYELYYAMRPEKKAGDDLTRSKPGLLSPRAKYFNPLLFASPEGSFFLTEALSEAVDGPVAVRQQTLPPEEMSAYIKSLAGYFGALNAGITALQQYHVYSHVGRGAGIYGAPIQLDHQFAIAFTVEMDFAMVGANPTPPGVMESARQYVEAARVAVQLAAAIRYLGYPARAHIDGNYRVVAPLVARDAGLGEIGRLGLLITPTHGPRVRLGVVTTDLPLVPDEPTRAASVIDFCTICKKCAAACPSRSIPFDDRQISNGTLRWQINPDTCFRYWNVIGTDCGRCLTVCPYSHPDTLSHRLVRAGIARSGTFRRAALALDDVFYGKVPAQRKAPAWTTVQPPNKNP